MVISMALLSQAMKTLPVGTAYAIWTGIGAVGAAITGILLLGEVCLTGAFAQSWLDRRGYHWAKTRCALIRRDIATSLIVLR